MSAAFDRCVDCPRYSDQPSEQYLRSRKSKLGRGMLAFSTVTGRDVVHASEEAPQDICERRSDIQLEIDEIMKKPAITAEDLAQIEALTAQLEQLDKWVKSVKPGDYHDAVVDKVFLGRINPDRTVHVPAIDGVPCHDTTSPFKKS